jgi:molybdopterin synthase catalytic subunit
MGRFYTHALKPTLAALIEDQVRDSAPFEEMDLSEELRLVRVVAGDAVALYAGLMEQQAAGAQVTLTQLHAAGQVMAQAMAQVADMCERAGRVEEARQKVGTQLAMALSVVITTVCQEAYAVFGDDFRVRDFERNLRERMAQKKVLGEGGRALATDLTPASVTRDASDMDETVPEFGADEDEDEDTETRKGEEA